MNVSDEQLNRVASKFRQSSWLRENKLTDEEFDNLLVAAKFLLSFGVKSFQDAIRLGYRELERYIKFSNLAKMMCYAGEEDKNRWEISKAWVFTDPKQFFAYKQLVERYVDLGCDDWIGDLRIVGLKPELEDELSPGRHGAVIGRLKRLYADYDLEVLYYLLQEDALDAVWAINGQMVYAYYRS